LWFRILRKWGGQNRFLVRDEDEEASGTKTNGTKTPPNALGKRGKEKLGESSEGDVQKGKSQG